MATLVKYNVSTNYPFFMADPTDMTQGKTGLSSFTVKLYRPDTNIWATITPTIDEVGDGLYQFDITTTIYGIRFMYITASGAVPWRDVIHVVDALPGELTDTMIDKVVASIFREPMTTIEASSYGDTITTTNLTLYKVVQAIVGKVALINGGTTKRIYKTDETSTALDLTLTSGAAPANPIIAQEP